MIAGVGGRHAFDFAFGEKLGDVADDWRLEFAVDNDVVFDRPYFDIQDI